MKMRVAIIPLALIAIYTSSCNHAPAAGKEKIVSPPAPDTALADYISKIRAVDNHAHPNTIDANNKGSDALPLDGLGNIELPARLRPASNTWLSAGKALFGFKDTVLNERGMKLLTDTAQAVSKNKGEQFPGDKKDSIAG